MKLTTNRPKYYYVSMMNMKAATVASTHDNDLDSDQLRRQRGNYFYSREEALAVAAKINAIFRGIVKARKAVLKTEQPCGR